MTLAAGSRLGPYEILSPLGAGGMGEVYRARDTRLERTVAIKVLPERLSSSEERRLQFERDAKTISQLSHPHICALYDIGRKLMTVEPTDGSGFESSAPRPLFQTRTPGVDLPGFHSYAVTPDGQRFLAVTEPEGRSSLPIGVVLDWAAELKR